MKFNFTLKGAIDASSKDEADIMINVLMNHRTIVDAEWRCEEIKVKDKN